MAEVARSGGGGVFYWPGDLSGVAESPQLRLALRPGVFSPLFRCDFLLVSGAAVRVAHYRGALRARDSVPRIDPHLRSFRAQPLRARNRVAVLQPHLPRRAVGRAGFGDLIERPDGIAADGAGGDSAGAVAHRRS